MSSVFSLLTALVKLERLSFISLTIFNASSLVTARLFLPDEVKDANSVFKLFNDVCAFVIAVVPLCNVVRRVSSFAIS